MRELKGPKEKSIPNAAPQGKRPGPPAAESIQKTDSTEKFVLWPAARPEPVEDIVGKERLQRLRIKLVGEEGVELGFKQIGKAVYHADNERLEGMYKKKEYPRKVVFDRYKTIDDAIRALEEHMVGENYTTEFVELNDMLDQLRHLNIAIDSYGKKERTISLDEKEDIKGRLTEFVKTLEKKHDLYKKVGGNKLVEAIDFLDKGGKFNINRSASVVYGARTRIERRRMELAPRSEWALERVDALRQIKRLENERFHVIKLKVEKAKEVIGGGLKRRNCRTLLLGNIAKELEMAGKMMGKAKLPRIFATKRLISLLEHSHHLRSVAEQMKQATRYVETDETEKTDLLISNALQRVKSEMKTLESRAVVSGNQKTYILNVLEEASALAVHHRKLNSSALWILNCWKMASEGDYKTAATMLDNTIKAIPNKMPQAQPTK